MEQKHKTKAVLSMRMAVHLIRQGFELWKIVPSLKVDGYSVFLFENTPKLDEAIGTFRAMRDQERR